MVKIVKKNTLCKNAQCTKGKNGERATFYACLYCTHIASFRSVACSPECYEAYIKQVRDARAKNKPVNLLPERTDMTEEQVKELMARPTEEVIEEAKAELKEIGMEGYSFAEATVRVNEQLTTDTGTKAENEPKNKSKGNQRKERKPKNPDGN